MFCVIVSKGKTRIASFTATKLCVANKIRNHFLTLGYEVVIEEQ